MSIETNNIEIPKVIYIAGTARSGTTILEVMLGSSDTCCGAGEITHFYDDAMLADIACSCNLPASQCSQWRSVHQYFTSAPEAGDLFKTIDRHKGFIKLLSGMLNKHELDAYRSMNAEVLTILATTTNSEYIIDSSKYCGRALALYRNYPGRVKIIFLTRSPAGLLHAFSKPNKDEQKSKSPLATLIYYLAVRLSVLITQVLVDDKDEIAISYEELKKNPVGTLENIQEKLQLNLERPINILKEDDIFQIGHVVTGNRFRNQPHVKFQTHLTEFNSKDIPARVCLFIMNQFNRLCGLIK